MGIHPQHESEAFLDVDAVTIHAKKVIIGEDRPPQPEEIVRRYRWNAFWFAVLVGLGAVYFSLHFNSYVSEGLVIGLPALWAFWQIVQSWLKKDLGEAAEDLRRKFLARPDTRGTLVFFCAALAAFLAVTSSIFIKLGGGDVAKATVVVMERVAKTPLHPSGMVPLLEPIELSATSRFGGKLFIPRFTSKTLTFVVQDPPGYELKEKPWREFRSWTAIDLTFNDDFRKKPRRALRIIPGWTLRGLMRKDTSKLGLMVKGQFGPARTLTGTPWRVIYVGVKDHPALDEIYRHSSTAEWAHELETELTNEHVPAAEIPKYIAWWSGNPVRGEMHDFRDGEEVTVTISGPGLEKAISRKVTLEDEVTTIRLEQ